MSSRYGGFVFTGLSEGAYVGAVYATVECWAATILPRITQPSNTRLEDGSISLTVVLFSFYPALGGLIGLVLGATLGSIETFRRQAERGDAGGAPRAIVTIIAIGSSTAMVLSLRAIGVSVLTLLALAVLLISVWILGLRRDALPPLLSWMANPWTSFALFIGLTWLSFSPAWPRSTKMIATVVFVGGAAVLTLGVSRLFRGAPDESRIPVPRALIVTSTAALVFCASVMLSRAVRPTFPNVPRAAASKTDTPNIVMVTLDTVRADHLSLYGYERDTSPNLTAFAKEATRYSSAFAPGNFTLPTHASFFTGLYPSQHGAHFTVEGRAGVPLDQSFTTLAELLAEGGYRTLAISANSVFVTSDYGFDQGFEYFDSRPGTTVWAPCSAAFSLRCAARNVLKQVVAPKAPDHLYRSAEQVNREVFSVLDRLGSDDRPFFLFVNYMDAHTPYVPPDPFDTLFPGKDRTFSWSSANVNSIARGAADGSRNLRPEERDHLVSQYDGAIAYLDSQLGELFGRLSGDLPKDAPLIVILSDHGEALGERGFWGHGGSVHQTEIGVPLVIRYPGQLEGRSVERPVSTVDLFSTILDIAGIGRPSNIAGESLVDIGLSDSMAILSESFPSEDGPLSRVERAIVSGSHKLIWSDKGKRELYDLSVDPHETADESGSNGKVAETLEALLMSWLESIEIARPTSPNLDEAALRRLRALGYIR